MANEADTSVDLLLTRPVLSVLRNGMGRNTQPMGGILTFGLLFPTNTNICSGHSDEGTGPPQNRLWEDCRSAE
jgi:hypothetical protein